MPMPTKLRFAFDVFLIVFFAWVAWEAWEFATLARYMPLFIAGMGMALGLAALVTDIQTYRRTGTAVGEDAQETAALGAVEQQWNEDEADAREASQAGADGAPAGEVERNPGATSTADADPMSERDPAEESPEEPPFPVIDDETRRRMERAALKRALGYLSVIVGYVALIWITGVFVASAVFLVFFLRVLAKTSWFVPIVGVVVVMAGLLLLENLVNVLWPPYLLEDLLGDFLPG
ncbi:hypothetical protein ER308_13705 [Egibacter rhizosphaerae]|uniref:Tripartite tricarboxylate transporter TctB family protein n=1 Tax=Egibacter rhizosphaerae TaxID=1670831 RepID=A0A411YGS9_9ACTN|nr:hypothetical protein [Egibacter rhizosphaerae]QBI20515.1 hypothetical protein ER308_13705 [Egibacter rhizosphaerae]